MRSADLVAVVVVVDERATKVRRYERTRSRVVRRVCASAARSFDARRGCLERRRIDAIDEGGGINFIAARVIHSIAFDRLDH